MPTSGRLIVNADDWGRDQDTTGKTLQCILKGTVSSVSAMVFMANSEPAAALALKHRIDAGLHLNFTTPFSGANRPAKLEECQGKVSRYLLSNPLARGFLSSDAGILFRIPGSCTA